MSNIVQSARIEIPAFLFFSRR